MTAYFSYQQITPGEISHSLATDGPKVIFISLGSFSIR